MKKVAIFQIKHLNTEQGAFAVVLVTVHQRDGQTRVSPLNTSKVFFHHTQNNLVSFAANCKAGETVPIC